MTKKRGLGSKRGLDALVGNINKEKQVLQTADISLQADQKSKTGEVLLMDIELERLQSGKYQPRQNIDNESLTELADSIRRHGVMQPIVIRPLLDSERKNTTVTHEIIAGERRWRASKLAGLESIPAIERVLSDEVAIALALIENIQREDLTVLEQAEALQKFHTEFGMSHGMIAQIIGKARTTVSNLLRLNQLHDDVKILMRTGKLDMGHARTLLALSCEQQPIIAKKIISAGMTVRDAEKLVKSILSPEPTKPKSTTHTITMLNQKLSDRFGATVKLKQNKDGKGSVEIFFHSHNELGELLSQFGIQGDL